MLAQIDTAASRAFLVACKMGEEGTRAVVPEFPLHGLGGGWRTASTADVIETMRSLARSSLAGTPRTAL